MALHKVCWLAMEGASRQMRSDCDDRQQVQSKERPLDYGKYWRTRRDSNPQNSDP
jgi:hypothetical protein